MDMPFDLLYIHAAFFIHAICRMKSNNKNNKINQDLIDKKNKLIEKFDSLDKILKNIWDENYKNRYKYTFEDKNQIKNLAEQYLDYLNADKI